MDLFYIFFASSSASHLFSHEYCLDSPRRVRCGGRLTMIHSSTPSFIFDSLPEGWPSGTRSLFKSNIKCAQPFNTCTQRALGRCSRSGVVAAQVSLLYINASYCFPPFSAIFCCCACPAFVVVVFAVLFVLLLPHLFLELSSVRRTVQTKALHGILRHWKHTLSSPVCKVSLKSCSELCLSAHGKAINRK